MFDGADEGIGVVFRDVVDGGGRGSESFRCGRDEGGLNSQIDSDEKRGCKHLGEFGSWRKFYYAGSLGLTFAPA